MDLIINKNLDPQNSRKKIDRFLSYDWFCELLKFVYQKEPILREINAKFESIAKKKLIEAIELAISENIIIRNNRRYYFKGIAVSNEYLTSCQVSLKPIVRECQQFLKSIKEKYSLNEEELLIFGYGLFFGDVFKEKYVPKQEKVTIVLEDASEFNQYSVFEKYSTKQYDWLAFSQINNPQSNWYDYFVHANSQIKKDEYQAIRKLLGDVHPDYFLEHLLQLYKKINRRGTLTLKTQTVYLQAALLMKQVTQKGNNFYLNIPFITKAEKKRELDFSQDFEESVKKINFSSYVEYLVFYQMLLEKIETFDQVVVYGL